MNIKGFIPDLAGAAVVAFAVWIIKDASGIAWGTQACGFIVGTACFLFLMFTIIRRMP